MLADLLTADMSPGNGNRGASNSARKNHSSNIPTSSRRDSVNSPNPQHPSEQKKKKVVKQPAGEENSEIIDVVAMDHSSISHRNLKDCPCGQSTEAGVWLIDCSRCHQYWHLDCVSLNGLGKGNINKLVDYLCPLCYVPPVPIGRVQFKAELCYYCESTLNLQRANNLTESVIAAEKLKSIASFSKDLAKIDFESVRDGLSAVQDLDLHMKHFLLNKEDLQKHHSKTEKIEANISKIAETIELKLPNTTNDSINTLSQSIQQLQGQINELATTAPQHPHKDSSATDQLLEKISKQLDDLQSNHSLPHIPEPSHPPPPSHPHVSEQLHKEQPLQLHRENYIEPELENQLIEYFESCSDKFHTEGERRCLSFGEQYKYTGSRSSAEPSEMPPLLKQLIDRINSDFVSEDQPKMNSCLINCYQGPNSSLPQHSDDEQSIHPESSIHTVSLGVACTMNFMAKCNGDNAQEHVCEPRSIYSMTRRSQEFFTHGISKGSISPGKRYSITFRSVSFRNRNSTCIIGDSNTCGLKFGSDPKKTFGKWMPGKQIYTPIIENIDPLVSCGYRNVVVHCAINDLKKEEVKNCADIKRVFSRFVNKIECIQAVNPKAHVYVCPPLPSKRAELNKKSLYFVRLIREELIPSNFGVTLVDGFDGFLDQSGLLSQHLSRRLNRYQKPDYLHLNWKGVAKLGVLIRNTVLLRMNGGTDRRRRPPASRDNEQPHTGVTEGYAGTAANGFGHNHDGYQS